MRLEKLGNSFTLIEMVHYSVCFSYETPIGYVNNVSHEVVATQNEWGKTTGKHLNLIEPNKFNRIPHRDLVENMKELGIW